MLQLKLLLHVGLIGQQPELEIDGKLSELALQFVDERVVVHHWLHRLSNRGLGTDSVLDHAEAEIVLRHWVVYIWRQLMLESDLASVETKVWLDVVGKARALPNNLLVSVVAIRYEISSLLMKMDRIHLLVDARI